MDEDIQETHSTSSTHEISMQDITSTHNHHNNIPAINSYSDLINPDIFLENFTSLINITTFIEDLKLLIEQRQELYVKKDSTSSDDRKCKKMKNIIVVKLKIVKKVILAYILKGDFYVAALIFISLRDDLSSSPSLPDIKNPNNLVLEFFKTLPDFVVTFLKLLLGDEEAWEKLLDDIEKDYVEDLVNFSKEFQNDQEKNVVSYDLEKIGEVLDNLNYPVSRQTFLYKDITETIEYSKSLFVSYDNNHRQLLNQEKISEINKVVIRVAILDSDKNARRRSLYKLDDCSNLAFKHLCIFSFYFMNLVENTSKTSSFQVDILKLLFRQIIDNTCGSTANLKNISIKDFEILPIEESIVNFKKTSIGQQYFTELMASNDRKKHDTDRTLPQELLFLKLQVVPKCYETVTKNENITCLDQYIDLSLFNYLVVDKFLIGDNRHQNDHNELTFDNIYNKFKNKFTILLEKFSPKQKFYFLSPLFLSFFKTHVILNPKYNLYFRAIIKFITKKGLKRLEIDIIDHFSPENYLYCIGKWYEEASKIKNEEERMTQYEFNKIFIKFMVDQDAQNESSSFMTELSKIFKQNSKNNINIKNSEFIQQNKIQNISISSNLNITDPDQNLTLNKYWQVESYKILKANEEKYGKTIKIEEESGGILTGDYSFEIDKNSIL